MIRIVVDVIVHALYILMHIFICLILLVIPTNRVVLIDAIVIGIWYTSNRRVKNTGSAGDEDKPMGSAAPFYLPTLDTAT